MIPRGYSLLLIMICLCLGCSRLPDLNSNEGALTQVGTEQCRAVFPQGKWQFTHAIEAVYPGGGENLLMGVTVVDASRRTIACALMTVEGLVLFQARLGQSFDVQRAMPPFDRDGFAAGLLADIRLIFLQPVAEQLQYGMIKALTATAAEPACRYTADNGVITDILPGDGKNWQIVLYNPQGNPVRTVTANPYGEQAGFPGRLQLVASGPAGYTLKLKLVDAVRLDD